MNWQIKTKITTTDQKQRLEKIKQALFKSRSLDESLIQEFLNPSRPTKESLLKQLPDLDKKSLSKAISIINKAIKDKTPIIVYGDYDADGVCATAILWETLHNLGATTLPFIPSRADHGYGLSQAGLDEALKLFPESKPLIITVDNGISANEAADYLKTKGINLIITDHHQLPQVLPTATAIVHSTLLCGSGISWLLASHLSKEPLSLELAAIGTVCDLLPLDTINRPLVKYGLLDLQHTSRPGLLALFSLSSIDIASPLTTYHLGFVIGPRLNATGRLNSALTSLRLLCTKNPSLAQKLAYELNSTNIERQKLTADFSKSAVNSFTKELPNILIVDSDDYHEGVIGLIAARLAQHFHRPALAISTQGDLAKGSARSIPGVDITSTLKVFESLFQSLGGHHQAAGFSLDKQNITSLKQKLIDHLSSLDKSLFDKYLSIELELLPQDIDRDLYSFITSLAPFGIANSEPVFSITLTPTIVTSLGKTGEHLKFSFQELPALEGLLFGADKKVSDFPKGPQSFAFILKENNFRGDSKLQLIIKDIQV